MQMSKILGRLENLEDSNLVLDQWSVANEVD